MKKLPSKSANKVESNINNSIPPIAGSIDLQKRGKLMNAQEESFSTTGSAAPNKDLDWVAPDEKARIQIILAAANHWDTITIQQRLIAFELANIQCPDSISPEEIADYTTRITEGSNTRPPSIIVAWSYYQIHKEMMVFANKYVYNELQQNGTIPMEELEYDNEKVTLLPDVQTFIEDYRANNS